ncbi:DUF935 family protein [Synechococcus sp. PCC 6312]|uniref:phage portal protein family protein n=1 Tax=Synechococcus sp. (strain ATCC 27167 / PCC 6312) TaxID=195253 RepID=UPI00029EEF62|nr:DUF935 family protein [Synechococcus sp. PCC 6312]AFY60346.1 Mu-like prophage protein gp29 [Synechococcus sp. PCC 6312]
MFPHVQVKAPSFSEIATVDGERDITRSWLGELLDSQDPIVRLRGHGRLEIYDKVLEDWQVHSTFQQRRRAVTRYRWEVSPGSRPNQEPGRAEKMAADFIRAVLDSINWDDITDKKLYGVFYGHSVAECMFARDGKQIILDDTKDGIRVRDRKRFVWDKNFGLRLLTREKSLYGEPLPPCKFWVFNTGGDHSDDPNGRGLGSWLYWPVLFKREQVRLELRYLDKFAGGSLIGKYPPGATLAQVKTLKEAMQQLRSGGGAAIPEGMMVEVLQASAAASSYSDFQDRMDESIAKVVLGQVGTSEGVAGQHRGEMQHDVRQDLVISDSDLVCGSFNRQVVKWLTHWNFPGAVPPQVYRKIENDPDPNTQADRDTKIIGLGFAPTLDYVKDQYGEGFIGAGEKGDGAGVPATLLPSLVQVITAVAGGQITATAGRQILVNTIPGITPEMAEAMVEEPPQEQSLDSQLQGALGGDGAAPKDTQQPQDPQQGDAAFSALIDQIQGLVEQPEFAQKKCSKGYPCKNACISTTKKCKSPLPGQASDFAGWVLTQTLTGGTLSAAQNQAAQGITVAQGLGLASTPTTPPPPSAWQNLPSTLTLPAPPAPAPTPPPKKPRAKKVKAATNAPTPPSIPVTGTDRLAEAIKNNDFATVVAESEAIYRDAKAWAKTYVDVARGDVGIDFRAGTTPGNFNKPDPILSVLMQTRTGFGDLPEVISRQEMERELATGKDVLYRGFSSERASFDARFTQLKTGEALGMHGIYGHGLYTAIAKGDDSLDRQNAHSTAVGYDGHGVVKMMPKDGFATVKDSLLKTETKRTQLAFGKWATKERNKLSDQAQADFDQKVKWAERVMWGDEGSAGISGRFAVLKGYDMVDISGVSYDSSYRLLLNRAKVKIQDERVSPRGKTI